MSFVPEFAPDARSQWRDLDPWLQELVLDEMEDMATHPPAPPKRTVRRNIFCDIGRTRHNLFIRALLDRRNGRLTVVGITHLHRPRGS